MKTEGRIPSATPYLWMLASAAAFTAMGAFTQALAGRAAWSLVAFVRAVLAFVFAAALVRQAGAEFVVWRPPSIWLRSLSGSASLVLTFYALPRLPMANVLTLTNMAPIWIAILSWPLLGQRLSASVWAAVAAGVCGATLVQRPEAGLLAGESTDPWAPWSALAASVMTAFAMIGLHKVKHLDGRAIVAHFSAVAAVVAGLTCIATSDRGFPPLPQDGLTWLLLLLVGASATAGQIFMTRAYAGGQPARVAVVGLSQVVFGLTIDLAYWHRSFDGWTLLGMALIVVPSGWIMAR
jgi:drug/metabolite transporter (DMT)-like permease